MLKPQLGKKVMYFFFNESTDSTKEFIGTTKKNSVIKEQETEPKKRSYEMYTYFGEENGWKVQERKLKNVQEKFLGFFCFVFFLKAAHIQNQIYLQSFNTRSPSKNIRRNTAGLKYHNCSFHSNSC